MEVVIFGPNLRDQSKGTFHVHAKGCAHAKHYGPGKRFGGDDFGDYVFEADTTEDVVEDIYGDQLNETPGDRAELINDWHSDFYFAPCVKGLK